MITITEIQKNLATAIKNSGFKQTELAKLLNVRQATISCYVRGVKMPALDTLANLCQVLDVDASEILGTNNPTSADAQIKALPLDDREMFLLFNCLDEKQKSHIIGYTKAMLKLNY